MKWNGVENGELLLLSAADGFDVVLTKDTGMPYEQNTQRLDASDLRTGEIASENAPQCYAVNIAGHSRRNPSNLGGELKDFCFDCRRLPASATYRVIA